HLVCRAVRRAEPCPCRKSSLRKLSIAAPDPPLLIVSGILAADGTMELQRWFTLPEGTVDSPSPGPFTLRLTDGAGTTLLTVPFDMPFEADVEPLGRVPTDVSGFAFAVPYPAETAKITIELADGTPITEVDPVSKTLEDAIDAVPSQCFDQNPSQRRN